MTPSELEKWLKTEESRKVGWKGADGSASESVGHASGRRIVKILRKRNADLTPDDYAHMEALSATATLLDFARHNNVDLIVIGAPGPEQQALAWWRSVASGVTANSSCSVLVVRNPADREG